MPADAAFFSLQKHGAGRGTALFNLCNIALGSGVLGFPAVYAQAGWLYATAFIAVFALLGAFSNTIMIRSASWYRVVSFHSVVREALGRRAVVEWEGVGDIDGNVLDLTPEGVDERVEELPALDDRVPPLVVQPGDGFSLGERHCG